MVPDTDILWDGSGGRVRVQGVAGTSRHRVRLAILAILSPPESFTSRIVFSELLILSGGF